MEDRNELPIRAWMGPLDDVLYPGIVVEPAGDESFEEGTV
jgi:hypothetical protein